MHLSSIPVVASALLFAASAAAAETDPAKLIHSPWMKFCQKGTDGKQVCLTGRDAREGPGRIVFSAALIEIDQPGEPQKLFRVTLPLGLQLAYGTRLIIDRNAPATAAFVTCLSSGCFADHHANADMLRALKEGKELTLQAVQLDGSTLSYTWSLTDFAKAQEGPPSDPQVASEQRAPPVAQPSKDDPTVKKELRPGQK
jgi:invasion protein IalB